MIQWIQGLFALPGYKLLAFAIALSGWLYVQGSETVEHKYRIGLAWKLPAGVVTTEPLPGSVLATVTGSRNAVRQADGANLMMAIDLSEQGTGAATVEFSTFELTGLPPNVTILGHAPSSLNLQLDESDTRKVALKAVTVGEPAPEYLVGAVQLTPGVVSIQGPRVLVEQLLEVSTKPIDISTLTAPTDFSVELALPRSITLVEGQGAVAAHIDVSPLVERHGFSGVEIALNPDWRTKVSGATVMLEGPATALKTLSEGDMLVKVVLPDEPDARRYEASFGPTEGLRLHVVGLPVGVRVVSCDPPTVEVTRR